VEQPQRRYLVLHLRNLNNVSYPIMSSLMVLILLRIIETNLGILTGTMPAFTIVTRHHGPSISSSLHTLTTKIGRIIPDASIRASKRLFSASATQYGEDSPRSDSYIELRHGIKVQHEFVISEARNSTAALPQVPDYFGPEVSMAGVGKKG